MQLGNILDGGAEFYPVGREVEFHVLKSVLETRGEDLAGERQYKTAECVKATFRFVDEQLRHEADSHADEVLRANPLYRKTGIIPADKRREEEFYAFLLRALRNVDDPTEPFCPLKDYHLFRRALVADVVTYLLREYKAYVRDEYPEILTADQAAEIVEEAAGK